jgi:hypothetical protein
MTNVPCVTYLQAMSERDVVHSTLPSAWNAVLKLTTTSLMKANDTPTSKTHIHPSASAAKERRKGTETAEYRISTIMRKSHLILLGPSGITMHAPLARVWSVVSSAVLVVSDWLNS